MKRMTKRLGLIALLIALVATPTLAASAASPHIDRCRGIVQPKVVHRPGHKPRTINVCVPATKRLDVAVGFGGPASGGFTVGVSFALAHSGAILQMRDGDNVVSIYGGTANFTPSGEALLVGAFDSSSGFDLRLGARTHRFVMTVDPSGMATYYLDTVHQAGSRVWEGAMPSTLHLSVGGWDVKPEALFPGKAGTTFYGSVGSLTVSPGIHPPAPPIN